MPLQNRVTPDGSIIADPARGLFMGNRGGQMHDDARALTGRRWVSQHWIACVLAYKNRHEAIMAPGHYTQLFFLDEATALASGHRPCALCRRADFLKFMTLWQQLRRLNARPKVADVDATLHAERITPGKSKVTFTAWLGDLPDGAIVLAPPAPFPAAGTAQLYLGGMLQAWSPAGYGARAEVPPDTSVRVLTPRSIVAILAAGYAPVLHASARSMSAARSA